MGGNYWKFLLVPFLAIGWGLFLHTGFFDSVDPIIEEAPSLSFVALRMTGPFHQLPQGFRQVQELMKSSNIPLISNQGIGVFFDDPAHVQESKLRWWVGWVVEKDYVIQKELSGGLFYVEFGPTRSIVATFPFRNMFSPMFGPSRVYPAIQRFIDEQQSLKMGPAIEIYDSNQGKIIYLIHQTDQPLMF
jgi:hypothetical protein